MLTSQRMRVRRIITSAVALALLFAPAAPRCALASDKPAEGWIQAGSAPRDYDMGVDRAATHGGKASGFLRSNKAKPAGFGTLMQMFKADKYRGKRLRLSAWVRAQDVSGWAGVWMRVDGPDGKMLAFDNMQSRPIKGTVGWRRYEVVLDVASEAVAVAFGVLLDGTGKTWIDDIGFEEVTTDVALTGAASASQYNPAPENLDFEK